MGKAVDKYLERFAEPEAKLASAVPGRYGYGLCVPAYRESIDTLRLLDDLSDDPRGSLLLCLVINAREDSPSEVLQINRQLLAALGQRYGPARTLGLGASWLATPFGGLCLLDRTGPGRLLPSNQGVGLARKIGADLLLALWQRGALGSPWLAMTDADARLPPSYPDTLERYRDASQLAALVFPFVHVPRSPQLRASVAGYECKLRVHVLGLARAGSPYAFHTIGSTLAVHANAYAQVRGVPRRHGAEDFYLLNKVAKVGGIQRLTGDPIRIAGRVSDRVPFGTGPALAGLRAGKQLQLYPQGAYLAVEAVLGALGRLARRPSELPQLQSMLPQTSGVDPAVLRQAFFALGLGRALAAALRRPTPAQRMRALHTLFDGFRTLKFIHHLRALGVSDTELHAGSAWLLTERFPDATALSAPQLRPVLEELEGRLASGLAGLPLFWPEGSLSSGSVSVDAS